MSKQKKEEGEETNAEKKRAAEQGNKSISMEEIKIQPNKIMREIIKHGEIIKLDGDSEEEPQTRKRIKLIEKEECNDTKQQNQEQPQANLDPQNKQINQGVDDTTDRQILSQAIIDKIICDDKRQWIHECTSRIRINFNRIPRNVWPIIQNRYKALFNEAVSVNEMKKIDYSCRLIKNNRSNSKEESVSVENLKLYKNTRNELMNNIKLYMNKENVKFERIPKPNVEKIDQQIIEYINKIVLEEKIEDRIQDIKDYNTMIYIAQLTYNNLEKNKTNQTTGWKENILKKIDKMNTGIEALRCFKNKDFSNDIAMRICKTNRIWSNDEQKINVIINKYTEKISARQKGLDMHEKRKETRKANNYFEFNRKRFYRSLEESNKQICSSLKNQEIAMYWEKIYQKRDGNNISYAIEQIKNNDKRSIEWDSARIKTEIGIIIKYLDNWKTPGHDQVYNYFIKKIAVLHEKLSALIEDLIRNPQNIPNDLVLGKTYLIPKEQEAKTAEKLRPITCLPNTYKILSKVISKWLQEFYEVGNILSENQMGTRPNCQGAKEQVKTNIAMNSHCDAQLKTCWIDIAKAYDSVDHECLIAILKAFDTPVTIIKFVETILKLQRAELLRDNNVIAKIKLERGIIQGDSLSPLLFVTCIEPLSRILNGNMEKVFIEDSKGKYYKSNHLIFIDDIKVFARNEKALEQICTQIERYLTLIGFTINQSKSAKNVESEKVFGRMIDELNGYKYLGILEGAKEVKTQLVKENIREKILNRVKLLCETKLNARNLFLAINEFAISPINYYIGLVEYETEELQELDREIRKILRGKKIHAQDSNTERLYLKRNDMGRGLICIEHKWEKINFTFKKYLQNRYLNNDKIRMIWENEESKCTNLILIEEFIKRKYKINEEINIKLIEEKQKHNLLQAINKKLIHSILYENQEKQYSRDKSSEWLKNGNISPQTERNLCRIQDRNCFHDGKEKCPVCKRGSKNIEHLATKCTGLLDMEYKKRHNNLVKCLHLHMSRRYGLTNCKRLKNYNVESIIENPRVVIKSDLPILTDIKIKENKPDLYIFDKVKNEIIIIEVGVTNKDILANTETRKKHKYELLGRELKQMYHCEVTIIPYVITWDGLVTKFNEEYCNKMNLPAKVKAYMQQQVIKDTYESIINWTPSE
ncbi:hypothetical protein ENBRE01_1768 [Enteropsectra breve]|nr:hypothetical protein ENBRE01_1768 [Enteropsectra breve]